MASPTSLTTPITSISFISSQYAQRLKKLGIETLEDLLFHLPARYEDVSHITDIANLTHSAVVTIKGSATNIQSRMTSRNRRLFIVEAVIQDTTGSIRAVWFNQPYLAQTLQDASKNDATVFIAGKVRIKDGELYFSSPAVEVARDNKPLVHTGRLVPVYPETYGLSSKWLRYAFTRLFPMTKDIIHETLPENLLETHNLMGRQEALHAIHFPETLEQARSAKHRFEFENMLTLHLAVLRARAKQKQNIAPAIPTTIPFIQKVVHDLPFTLTDSQKKAIWKIVKDTELSTPMNRLLEGDVGSGKTIVASIAAMNAVQAHYQVAVMAPTEVLALQHYETIKKICDPYDITVSLVTRTKKETEATTAHIVVGTHALIQNTIDITKLGLVIIDEQHKFGVAQRAHLIKHKKEHTPHLLSMTATPIPRTLALTIYGDLDISLLQEIPKGRKKIQTSLVREQDRASKIEFIHTLLDKGQQVFVVVPLIEESEAIQTKSALQEYERLSSGDFRQYTIGLLHGRMKPKEKEKIMNEFQRGALQVLVTTSVIEVGIDIPNATVMMIEGAERFGLAQLHQFRGRVGRSTMQSYCFVFPSSGSPQVLKRIQAFIKAKNGFELAEYDMKLRGSGEIYGTKQSGVSSLIVNSLDNYTLIETTRNLARDMLQNDPLLSTTPNLEPKLRALEEQLHFE